MNTEQKQTLDIGYIVDLPFEDFKKGIEEQKVSIGIINNLIFLLSSTYNDLTHRKEAVLKLLFTGKENKETIQPVLKGIYAEMFKLEQKVVYLKERSNRLLYVDEHLS